MNIAVWYKIAMVAIRVARYAERRYLDKARANQTKAIEKKTPRKVKKDLGHIAINFEELKRKAEERANESTSPETVRQDNSEDQN